MDHLDELDREFEPGVAPTCSRAQGICGKVLRVAVTRAKMGMVGRHNRTNT